MSAPVATPQARPSRLSAEFIDQRRRARIVDALAELIVKRGYFETHVAHIVKDAGMARKTLYETFPGKEAAAFGLLNEVCPAAADLQLQDDLEDSSVGLLSIGLAAALRVGDARAGSRAEAAAAFVADLADFDVSSVLLASEGDPLGCTLPPGRHGLSREFVRRNHRTRLVAGAASAFASYGYHPTTLAEITHCAAVSRRTFYEHFKNKADVAGALIQAAGVTPAEGCGPLAAELLSTGIVHGTEAMRAKVDESLKVIAALAEAGEVRADA